MTSGNNQKELGEAVKAIAPVIGLMIAVFTLLEILLPTGLTQPIGALIIGFIFTGIWVWMGKLDWGRALIIWLTVSIGLIILYLFVSRPAIVVGFVVDSSNAPVKGLTLVLTDANGVDHKSVTDESGAFEIRNVSEGKFTISANGELLISGRVPSGWKQIINSQLEIGSLVHKPNPTVAAIPTAVAVISDIPTPASLAPTDTPSPSPTPTFTPSPFPTNTPTVTPTPTPTSNTTATAQAVRAASNATATAQAQQVATTQTAQAQIAAQQTVAAARATADAATVQAIENPLIDIRADRREINEGECTTLHWNIQNVREVYLNGAGIPGVGEQPVCPPTTTTYTWHIVKFNGGEMERVITITVNPAGPTLVYDLIAKADTAHWSSDAGDLSWNGSDSDDRGFVLWRDNFSMEDDSQPPRVLEAHPQWVKYGRIDGTFTDIYDSGYVVQEGDIFIAKVGLLKGAGAGSVTFRVMIRPEGGPNIWIGEVSDNYDGSLKTLQIPLSAWAGKRADFILRVEAGPSSAQDWATWVIAQIER